MELTILKTTIKEEYGKAGKNYATLIVNDTEIGYITDEGIFLRLYNPGTPFGVLDKVATGEKKQFFQYCQFIEKHWSAIYDRYDLLIKKGMEI